jgi:hypothetical protein
MITRRMRRLGLLALILLLTGLLVLLLYGPMYKVLSPWLARAYGTIRTYYRTIPQPILWLACIGAGVLVAVKSLMLNARWSPEEKPPPISKGRVQTLRLWVRQAGSEVYFDRRLALLLGKLALEIQSRSSDHEDSPGPMRQRMESLDLPPHVREYLRSGLEPMVANRPRPLGFSWLVSLFRPPEMQPAPHVDLEEIVQLLEDQLEVRDDND